MTSRQVSWWAVHEHVQPALDAAGEWPMAGTPAWCVLPDGDPVKLAALLDAAQQWALRLDALQEAQCEVSRAISAAADWSAVARAKRQRAHAVANGAYIARVSS